MAAHPVAFAGLLRPHRRARRPYARLQRTAQVMDTVAFGTEATRRPATARVRAMHRTCAASWPRPPARSRRTPYRADDPELLLWILAALAESAIARLPRATSPADARRARRAVARLPRRRPPFGLRERDNAGRHRRLRDLHGRHVRARRPAVTPAAARAGDPIVLRPPVPLRASRCVELSTSHDRLAAAALRHQYGFFGTRCGAGAARGRRSSGAWSCRCAGPAAAHPAGPHVAPRARTIPATGRSRCGRCSTPGIPRNLARSGGARRTAAAAEGT